MSLWTRPFVLECPSRGWPRLNMTANRYRTFNSPVDGLTLLFFHCNSAHKEQWEPIIEHLFSQSGSSHLRIREAWAFDWPTHGDAAILNQELLKNRTDFVSVYDWVAGVVQFFRSNYMRGHRVVLCGHSAGATTAVLTAAEFYPNLASVGIIGLILVESTMMTAQVATGKEMEARRSRMMILSSSKRDNWKSRKDALQYFQNKRPWSKWDLRVLSLYVEHGLYEHPDRGVVLKCDKNNESYAFEDKKPHIDGIARLGKLSSALSSHAIWGEWLDYIPDSARTAHSDLSQGRVMASVSKVEQAGHMVVQEQPIKLAQIICRILETMSIVSAKRSNL